MLLIGRRCHILHLTDKEAEHHLLAELAEPSELLVLKHASTGDEALQRLRGAIPPVRPNLVLMSWDLNGMSGEEFLVTLKSEPAIRAVPVIVFTSDVPHVEIDRIYSLGANCVIEQTLDPDNNTRNLQLLCSFWANVARLPYCEPAHPARFSS
jgi:chemotaxis family two-component system response regulator Rcp1